MPTYVYRCSECFVQYERVQSMREDTDTVCLECGEEAIKRILQSPATTAAATPSIKNKVPPPQADPAWERGSKGELRRDGSFVPYLDSEGKRIGVKKWADNRTKYEGLLRDRANSKPTTT